MKILLVHKFWKQVGGAEVYFQDVARILKNKGHEVRIYTTAYDAEGSRNVYPADSSVTFGHFTEYLQGSLLKRIAAVPPTIYSFRNRSEFGGLLDEFKPDVVHVFAIYVTITPSILDACRHRNIPVVMSCNDYKHICPNYRLFHHGHVCEDCRGGKFYNAVLNNCCKHSAAVSAVSSLESYIHAALNIWKKNISAFLFESRFMLEKTKSFWGPVSNSLDYVGKPFNTLNYNPSYNDEGYVLYAGRLSDEKGVDVLLQSLADHPEIILHIAGDGEYRPKLEKMATDLALKNVTFLGSLYGDEYRNALNNCRFVVVPSVWYENFPYVMMEAFASGKAVIGSDKGGIPEYIQEGVTGYTYPADDHKKLGQLILNLFRNPAKATESGRNARKYALENFTDETFYTRLSAVYQKVTGNLAKKPEFS